MESITGTISQFCSHTTWDNIPPEAIEMCKIHILDTMGVLFAGSWDEIAGIVTKYIQSLGCQEECTLLTQGIKTSSPYAAFGNGILAHVLDFDDYEGFSKAHVSATLWPAVMALGEKLHANGKDCLAAYLMGVEVIAKIGRGINPDHYERGWHSTGTLGTIGAAVACSKLLKLDPGETARAIGVSASMASGLRGNFGTMTKALHAGHAAKSGLESALLASLGFTASENILASDLGFCHIFADKDHYDARKITADLGSPFSIVSPGVGKKLYPSCAATHSFIDGVLHLMHQYDIRAKDVDSVECGIFYLYPKMFIHSNPRTGLEGKFSLEFCIALALQEKDVSINHFTDSKVNEPGIQSLIKRVKKFVTEKVGGRGTQHPAAIINVTLKDGKRYSHKVKARKGSAANPLNRQEVIDKFNRCAHLVYNEDEAHKIFEVIMNIETVEDIRQWIQLTKCSSVS